MTTSWPLPEYELKSALELALAVEHAPMGMLLLREAESGALRSVASEGLSSEQEALCGVLHADGGLISRACAQHERMAIRDALAADVERSIRDAADHVGFRGLAAVPLMLHEGDSCGAVVLLFRAARHPRARMERTCAACAHLMALAIETAQARAVEAQRREEAESLARERVQFVARMSHELRSPLQSITGYLDLLRAGHPDAPTPHQLDMLNRMERSERVLLSVIGDLTNLARLEAGRVAIVRKAVHATEMMTAAETVVAPLAQRRGVEVDVVQPIEDIVALADASKTTQILINLLTNGVKYTPAGGVVWLVSRQDDRAVYFDVTDTGPGIAPEHLSVIFDPYVQLERRVPQELDGCGLGLAIGREFAAAMRGELTVKSEVGRGSTFTLRLPRFRPGVAVHSRNAERRTRVV